LPTEKKIPFGLDSNTLKTIDWELATRRILNDIKSDFIYAPHMQFIYHRASKQLAANVIKDLKNGEYTPGLPLQIEVPKTARMRSKKLARLGPVYSRPGSTLLPYDRILYQALGDKCAELVKKNTDHARSFSHQLADRVSDSMFVPTRICWNAFQKKLAALSEKTKNRYVLRTDIANCFGAINQHILINKLKDAGLQNDLADRLEVILTAYMGERNSRGILQGMYTSDLLGNFYLNSIDRHLSDSGLDSARYVDDVYIFVSNSRRAEQVARDLIATLREYDLSLNESKSAFMAAGNLISEEPDLDELFQHAVEEISSQLEDEDQGVDYGFQTDWDDEGEDVSDGDDEEAYDGDLELKATISLFESSVDYPDQQENIERFCIPLFTKANSSFAIPHVIENFLKRPAMAQIYASYLVKFIDDADVREFMFKLVSDDGLMDWQTMWVLAALLRLEKGNATDELVKAVAAIYGNANRHEALRAVAAILVGRFGDHGRRKTLISSYGTVGSPYIQSAIFFASQWFPKAEKQTAKAAWSNHNRLNMLITQAFAGKSKG
jgi:hypothetical protein